MRVFDEHLPLLFHCWNLWYRRQEQTQQTQLSTIRVSTTATQMSARNFSYSSSLYLVPMSGITATSSTSVTKTVKLRCAGLAVSAIVLLLRTNTPCKQISLHFVLFLLMFSLFVLSRYHRKFQDNSCLTCIK
jgi:hypothetical protein